VKTGNYASNAERQQGPMSARVSACSIHLFLPVSEGMVTCQPGQADRSPQRLPPASALYPSTESRRNEDVVDYDHEVESANDDDDLPENESS
jgi:hypothetical protein